MSNMQYSRKPGNYWKDFSHVEIELLAFIAEYGTPGVMPIKAELLKARRGDLAKAIIKTHGGIEVVAERLGLQLPSYKRKKRGYWEDFANVTSELQNFIAERGMPGVMPTQDDLTKAGLTSLTNAIDHHGGMYAVAERLGLRPSHARRPNGYWDDIANVEHELLAFVNEHGTPGVMPSRNDLRQAGFHDLNGVLEKHGGTAAVAKRLNLKPKFKPTGHWDNFKNVEAALGTYIEEQGTAGTMPTISELRSAGLNSLAIAITKKYGGVATVAKCLGLELSYTAKPGGYWSDVSRIKQELHQFNAERGMPGIMPTSSELQKAGRGGLVTAITNQGGFPSIAEQFGLTYTYTAKPDRYWDDFENVQREIFDFIQIQGTVGTMPTSAELRKVGKQSLVAAISSKHRGFSVVAERLGLAVAKKSNGYWDDFVNVERELLSFIQEYGTPGVMPTSNALEDVGRSNLVFAIHKHGGMATVRERLGLSIPPKRPGPWDDFSRVEQELYTFIDTQGIAGVMPTREQLKQAGRSDLIGAIDTNGGSFAVAQRLQLQLTSGNKPNGYWDDFARIEEAIKSFLITSPTPETMPTLAQLKQAGQGDLVAAIARHGGIGAVSQRLGLQLNSSNHPDGYWNDFSHVEEELRSFIHGQDTPGVMPTGAQLRDAGYGSLLKGIVKHGGIAATAQRLGLKLASTAKPSGYWNDFAHIEQELNEYIQEYGTPGVMPTQSELNKAGRLDLVNAIQGAHGGLTAVAQRLGLQQQVSSKQAGYWKDFANVERELRAWIAAHSSPETMPALQVLRTNGQTSLASAIAHHGGFPAVAQRLGLTYAYTAKPAGYWSDFSHIEQAVNTFIEEYGMPGIMPTRGELRDAGWHDLGIALGKHGGSIAVAERMGLQLSYTKRALGYWKDFANVERELLEYINANGLAGEMPSRDELHVARLSGLSDAVIKHGGFAAVATRLGLTHIATKPNGYWDDFANVEHELLAFIHAAGKDGTMPAVEELRKAKQSSLAMGVNRHGGFPAVAQRLGLEYKGPELITPETATRVEHLARSIQPLAESNLLSGAQVMIIQRRAGMLDYRNARITRLNASLAHGNHNAIELALTQLRKAPEEETVDFLEDEEMIQQDLAETELESVVGSDLPIEQESPLSPIGSTETVPDLHQEQVAIRGLSALGATRLPLDEVLGLLSSKILWEAFYKRLYIWYGSLHSTQTVTTDDVQSAVLSAYAGQMDNEFVIQAAARFTQEVEQAVNFATRLVQYGWTGPHLRLHQADAARRMADILIKRGHSAFLLDADDPGMGKSASFLAAVAASGICRVILLAPKTVADDTWADDTRGEIRKCLSHASIVRGLRETLDAATSSSGASPAFFILHYEELLNDEMVDRLIREGFDCLCIDEVHFVKQRGGQKETYRREALEKLRAVAQSSIGLTGTPLVNELAEPLSLLQILSNNDPQFHYTRLNNRRMSDIADVFEAVLPHIVRRRKKDVLLHLPLCDVRPVEIPLQDDLLEQTYTISMWPRAQANSALAELRKIALEAKLPFIRKRAGSAKKLLVLTYLRDEVAEAIYADLHDFFPGQVGQINGTIPKEQRKDILDAFRASDGLRILVGTIGTIGVGLTLFDPAQEQTAHEILVADLPYTAAEFDQGIARLHREGQKHRVVVDVLLTTTNALLHDGAPLRTIDQRIWDLILGKRELSDVAIDGMYSAVDAATKVRKALHRWLKQIRETGVEPLVAEQRPAEQSAAQKWRGEIARLRGMSAAKADKLFDNAEYTKAFLDHLSTSSASQLAYQWLRAKFEYLLRPDLCIIDMGCGLNPFAELPCHVIGLDRHGLSGQVKGKMEKPPFPDASVDVLIYSLSLYGTGDDLRAYFTHAKRILRGGGHLFIVEPGSSFTPDGLTRFVRDLQQFGFEQVGNIREIRSEDGIVLKGIHFTLTGEVGKPEETVFERK